MAAGHVPSTCSLCSAAGARRPQQPDRRVRRLAIIRAYHPAVPRTPAARAGRAPGAGASAAAAAQSAAAVLGLPWRRVPAALLRPAAAGQRSNDSDNVDYDPAHCPHPLFGGQARAERRARHLRRRRRALERLGAAAAGRCAAACRAAAAQLSQQRRIVLSRGRQCMPAAQWHPSLPGPVVAPYRQSCDWRCLQVTAPYMP